jgi:hypothetical protein
VRITASDIGLDAQMSSLPPDHPLALAVDGVMRQMVSRSCGPAAAGILYYTYRRRLGSGAAVSVAIAGRCRPSWGTAGR